MHLEEMKKEIEQLVLDKGFYNKPEDIPKKLLFAFIELGEASDSWKKGESQEIVAEELIDTIFYILDASRLACPNINMDQMFQQKLDKNKRRPHQYGEGHRKEKPTSWLRLPTMGYRLGLSCFPSALLTLLGFFKPANSNAAALHFDPILAVQIPVINKLVHQPRQLI